MDIQYSLTVEDTIATIAPITDIVTLESQNNEIEYLCASGFHLRSYLAFVKEGIPYDSRVLN
jgi:hypothetical protein